MSAWVFCEYRYQNGDFWLKMAEFDVGSPRRLHLALEKSGLHERGLPPACSLLDGYEDLIGNSFGVTWLTAQELPLLQNDRLWLTVEELERVPPHAYTGYGERDTIKAWEAFAGAHEASGNPTRFVFWFAW